MNNGHTKYIGLHKFALFLTVFFLTLSTVPNFFSLNVVAAKDCTDPANFDRFKKNYCDYLQYWSNYTEVIKLTSKDLKSFATIDAGENWTQGATVTKDYFIYTLTRTAREINGEDNYIVVADKNFNVLRTFGSNEWHHMHSIWNKPGTNIIRINTTRNNNLPDICYDLSNDFVNEGLKKIDCSKSGLAQLKAYNQNGLTYQGEAKNGDYIYTATWDSGKKSWVRRDDLSVKCEDTDPDDICQYKFTGEQMHYERDNNAIFVRKASNSNLERILYISKKVVKGELESVSFDYSTNQMIIGIADNPTPGKGVIKFFSVDPSIYDPSYEPDDDLGPPIIAEESDTPSEPSKNGSSKESDDKNDNKNDGKNDSKNDNKNDNKNNSKTNDDIIYDDIPSGTSSPEDTPSATQPSFPETTPPDNTPPPTATPTNTNNGTAKIWSVGGDEPAVCQDASATAAAKQAAGCNNYGKQGLTNNLVNIINGIISVLGILAIIGIIIGGIQYMTATGNNDKLQTAKRTILYSSIGLVICILSLAIVNFVIHVST